MKLAMITPAAERAERRERLRRDRATALPLREVYPAVQYVRLELLFKGSGPSIPAMQSHTLHAAARAFFEFPCPYADCDGQFDLSGAVKAAFADATHSTTGDLECTGKRPARTGTSDPCRLHLAYTVTATLQPRT